MQIRKEKIVCRFIGNFKVGDNLVYNANILCDLVDSDKGASFNKLVVLQAGAIIEASLSEIIYRAQNFNREGVPNISAKDRQEIEQKKVERFKAIIDVMKKYELLHGMGEGVYAELEQLREYRNKVHIQADIGIEGVSRDEPKAFTAALRDQFLRLNVLILNYLNQSFPRPDDLEQFAHALTIPNP